ncbi:MAG: hypothetical protein ACXVHJ_10705 [Solirubrobacteraceae bacterium]
MTVSSSANARVLRVGSFHGISSQFATIQAAVDAARPGDWILIGPGDYKTTTSRHPAGKTDSPAGVLVTKPRIYIRGMNRDTVIVDGTKPGSAPCSTKKSAQNSDRARRTEGSVSTGSRCGRPTTFGCRT